MFAALDQSTASTKVAVFDLQGNQHYHHMLYHDQITLQPGWLEHDPIQLLENTIACLETIDFKIEALGLTCQRETTVMWNKHTGKPYMNAIVWSDARTQQICQEYLEKYDKNHFQKVTGLPINTYFSAYKMIWMLRHQPINDDIYFGTIDTWLIWNLTGNYLTDVTNASRTMLMNLNTLDWDEDMLKLFGIPKSALPTIVPSGSNFGAIRQGKLKGVEIRAVLGDQQAASIGHGLFKKGDTKNTYGSGLFLLCNIGTDIRISNEGLLTTVLYQEQGEPAVYAFEGAVESGGQMLNWAKDKQHWFNTWDELSEAAKVHSDGVYFIPGFNGLFTPYWTACTGTLLGLTYHSTPDHIRRALLDAICYRTKDVIEAMSRSGIQIESLNIDGGLTVNAELMQLQSDVIKRALLKPEITDSTCLGVAMFTALSIKAISKEQITKQLRINRKYNPKENNEQQYEQWLKAVKCAMSYVQ